MVGSPASPSALMSRPCLLPHHCRAAARPVRLAKVALGVSTPPQSFGNPKRSFNQPSVTVSIVVANCEDVHSPAF